MMTHALIRPRLVGVAAGCALALLAICAADAARAHQGHTDTAPWAACEAAALSAACEWEDAAHGVHIGTCREVSGALLCVRNKPIVYPDHPSADHPDTPQPASPAPTPPAAPSTASGDVSADARAGMPRALWIVAAALALLVGAALTVARAQRR
jgi:hypothetical protein